MERATRPASSLAVAFAEPESRYELERVKTRATAGDDGGFVLNGQKSVVLNAGAADKIVVTARTSGDDADQTGISLFLVPADAAGLSVTTYRLNDETSAGDVSLKDVHVPASALLGEFDQGFELLEEAVDFATVAACAEAVGAMEAIMTMTADYLKTREQFTADAT